MTSTGDHLVGVVPRTLPARVAAGWRTMRPSRFEQCFPDIEDDRGRWSSSGVKTVVLFFDKGLATRKTWFYQLDPGRNLGKTNPLSDDDLAELVKLQKTNVPWSWAKSREQIEDDALRELGAVVKKVPQPRKPGKQPRKP